MSAPRSRQSQKRKNYVQKRKKKLNRNGMILIFLLFASLVVSIFVVLFTLP